MRTEKENQYLVKAIETLGKNFIVISPEFRVIAANALPLAETPGGQEPWCHKILHDRFTPCENCPVHGVRNTLTAMPIAGATPKSACLSAHPILEGERLDAIVVYYFTPRAMAAPDPFEAGGFESPLSSHPPMPIAESFDFKVLKPDYVSTLARKLLSPLSTIHEQLDMVMKYMPHTPFEEKEKVLTRTREKTRQLISLLNDLIDLSTIESSREWMSPEPVRVDRMLKGIMEFLRPMAEEKEQSMRSELPDAPLPPITADPMAMESIFRNLLTNAINYTPRRENIVVTASCNRKNVKVEVCDTGIGIAERNHERIFDDFFRVRDERTRRVKGRGLGLSLVKGMVTAHGGSISVASTPGKGSRFTVQFPIGGGGTAAG